MRRNLPNLLNLYLRVGPKLNSTRSKYNDSYHPMEIKTKVTGVKTRHPSSVFHLPVVDSVVPSPTAPTVHESLPDILAGEVLSAQSTGQLFEIVTKKGKVLKQNHITMIFQSITRFQNQEKTYIHHDSIKKDEGFIKLCQQLQRVAPSRADTNDLITCLKALVNCNVEPGSSVLNTVLHLLKSKVNELPIQAFFFVDAILKRVKSPLADAITIALPVVFETQLETQLNLDDVRSMCQCLRYAIDRRMPVSKIKFIADSLLANSRKWEINEICSVISSLSNLRFLSEHGILPLLENALNRLAKVVNHIEPNLLNIMCCKISGNYTNLSRYWYNEEFCNAVAQRVLQEQWDFTLTIGIGQAFTKLFYVNLEFLEYYSSFTESIISKNLRMHPRHILTAFAEANYKPPTLGKVVDFVIAYRQPIKSPIEWLRFAVNCAILGIYPHSLISQIFEESVLSLYFAKDPSFYDYLQLNTLNRCVRTECPEYEGSYPSLSLIKQAHQRIYERGKKKEDVHFSLKKALQTGFGGVSYVASGLLTKSGHFVEYVVTMRPGGYPVAINCSTPDSNVLRYLEDLNGTSGCQIVLITVFDSFCYSSNGSRLRGVFQLGLRLLEREGYDVVPVNLSQWESLQDYEKIPFVMQQIRLKEKCIS